MSVTQAEYREARRTKRPTLAFIERVEAEPSQQKFIGELQDYVSGFFRRTFSSPEELKDEIVQSLRQLDESNRAASEDAFAQRLSQIAINTTAGRFAPAPNQPTLTAAWWPQPLLDQPLNDLEANLDHYFDRLCEQRLMSKQSGYKAISARDHVGLEAQDQSIRLCEDGLLVYSGLCRRDNHQSPFAGMFVSPVQVRDAALAAAQLCDATGAWCHLSLRGMAQRNFAEPPTGNQHSMSMPMMGGDGDVQRNVLLIPYTIENYQQFLDRAIDQFDRELKHRH